MSETAPSPAPSPATPPPAPATPPVNTPPVQKWPDNWRDEMAGGDEDFRKTLDRFNSPDAVVKSWREMRQKMDSGEYRRNVEYKAEWSDEEKAQYRKENGIPDAPDKYTLPQGLVLGEADKPAVDKFLADMHSANLPDKYAGAVVDWYFKSQAEQQAAETTSDKQFQAQAEETLRTEWGPEYNANKNMAQEFATQRFGAEVGKALMGAGADVVKAVADLAREINPMMTLAPNSSAPGQALADELTSRRKQMGQPGWAKNAAGQERYKQLIAAGVGKK